MKRIFLLMTIALALVGCDQSTSAPRGPVFVVEVVPGETFRILLHDPDRIAEARSLLTTGQATVVHGELARGSGGFNTGFSWHLEPRSVTFVDVAMELCDGRPSFLESQLDYYLESVKYYCPWGGRGYWPRSRAADRRSPALVVRSREGLSTIGITGTGERRAGGRWLRMGDRLEGKIALVTGAARGIGAAIAQRFTDEGATVVLTDIRDDEGIATAQRIGGRAVYRQLDVRVEEEWQNAMAWLLDRYGRLDVLVNNAGITGFEEGQVAPHDPEHASLEDWRAVHRTNLDGVFLGCKYAIGAMRPAGVGSIVNISSRSGLVGIPGAAAYASSKAAVRNHTRTVALYCAEQGLKIRCNAVLPAAILTPMWEPMLGEGPDRDRRMRELVEDAPLRRFGTPDEVAAVVVHLASDESAYTTGAEFVLDGGLLAGTAARPSR